MVEYKAKDGKIFYDAQQCSIYNDTLLQCPYCLGSGIIEKSTYCCVCLNKKYFSPDNYKIIIEIVNDDGKIFRFNQKD